MANKSIIKHRKLDRRQRGIRKHIRGSREIPRLCVYRSLRNIFTQIIDDDAMATLVSCSSIDKDMVSSVKKVKNKSDLSALIGESLAKKALEKGIKQVVFDRNRYFYHGRVKAIAESARKAGLKF